MTLLKEPLFHFLLLGAAVFGGHSLLADEYVTEPGHIVVTGGRIQSLAAAFERTWQRPPTAREREDLIRDYIREEVYAREAIALGLDQDDIVIRRRLRQKLEFVSEGVTMPAEPTDEQLRAYLAAHPAAFRVEPRFTFQHVFLSSERRGDNLPHDAARLLAQLRAGAGPDTVGDPFLLDRRFEALPASLIGQQFGARFASELEAVAIGRWDGPVASAYGVHLVLVAERTVDRLPALEEVRDVVRREWIRARQLEASDNLYQSLLRRYTVTIASQPRATRP